MKALRVAGCVIKLDEQGVSIEGPLDGHLAIPQSSRKLTSSQAWRIADWFDDLGSELYLYRKEQDRGSRS